MLQLQELPLVTQPAAECASPAAAVAAARWPAWRSGWLLMSVLAALAFAVPYFLVLATGADYIAFAGESLSMRFGFCYRILLGEKNLWVPQGHTLSAMQQIILLSLHWLPGWENMPLVEQANLFGAVTSGLLVLLQATVLIVVGQLRSISWADKLLVLAVALSPLYVLYIVGFEYYSKPDYYHLTIILTTAATAAVIWQVKNHEPIQCWRWAAMAGVLVGLLIGNKITLAIMGGMVLAPLILIQRGQLKKTAFRLAVAGCATAATLAALLSVIYLFQLRAVIATLGIWYRFMKNAGTEPGFWDEVGSTFHGYHYSWLVGWWVFSMIAAIVVMRLHRPSFREAPVLLLASFVGVCGAAYCVYRRPANTTLFEVNVLVTALAAINLSLITHWRPGRLLAAGSAALLFAAGLATSDIGFPKQIAYLRSQGQMERNLASIHREVIRLADGRRVIVLIPNNDYCFGGIIELLLKGFSYILSWKISADCQPLLDRHAPNFEFWYHENAKDYGGRMPTDDAVLVWANMPNVPPQENTCPVIQHHLQLHNVQRHSWVVDPFSPSPAVVINVLMLPGARKQ